MLWESWWWRGERLTPGTRECSVPGDFNVSCGTSRLNMNEPRWNTKLLHTLSTTNPRYFSTPLVTQQTDNHSRFSLCLSFIKGLGLLLQAECSADRERMSHNADQRDTKPRACVHDMYQHVSSSIGVPRIWGGGRHGIKECCVRAYCNTHRAYFHVEPSL